MGEVQPTNTWPCCEASQSKVGYANTKLENGFEQICYEIWRTGDYSPTQLTQNFLQALKFNATRQYNQKRP
jgi:hypothetical protein